MIVLGTYLLHFLYSILFIFLSFLTILLILTLSLILKFLNSALLFKSILFLKHLRVVVKRHWTGMEMALFFLLRIIIDIEESYRAFSHDVTTAMLVFQTNPIGVELFTGLPVRPVIKWAFGRLRRKTASRGREDTRVWYRETMFS